MPLEDCDSCGGERHIGAVTNKFGYTYLCGRCYVKLKPGSGTSEPLSDKEQRRLR